MTKNDTINSGLLTAFGVLTAGLVPAFTTNFWYGIVDLLAIVGLAVIYTKYFND